MLTWISTLKMKICLIVLVFSFIRQLGHTQCSVFQKNKCIYTKIKLNT